MQKRKFKLIVVACLAVSLTALIAWVRSHSREDIVISLSTLTATTGPSSVLKIENPFADCKDAVAVLEELTASGAGDIGLSINSSVLLAQMVVANKIYKSGGDVAAAREVQQYFVLHGIDQHQIKPGASRIAVEAWIRRTANTRTITTSSVFTATNTLWGLGDPKLPQIDYDTRLLTAQKVVLIAVQNSDRPEEIRQSLASRYFREGLPAAAFELARLRKDVLTSVVGDLAAEGNLQNRMAIERRAKVLYGFTPDEIRKGATTCPASRKGVATDSFAHIKNQK